MFKADLLSCGSNPHCKQYCHLCLLSSGILPWSCPLWAAGAWQRPCCGVSASKPRFAEVKRWDVKKRDVKPITAATYFTASTNNVSYIPVILPSVVIVEEGLCTIQHHGPVQMMHSWTMRCVRQHILWVNSIWWLVIRIKKGTLFKYINYVIFQYVVLHNCVQTVFVHEDSEYISTVMVLKRYSRHSDVFVENWGHDGRMALGWYTSHISSSCLLISPKPAPWKQRQTEIINNPSQEKAGG